MPYLESISPHFQYVKIYIGCSIPLRPAAWCQTNQCRIGQTTFILLYFMVCNKLCMLRHTPMIRGIFPWPNRALAALSSHVSFSLLGAELAKLHSEYCISPHFNYVKIYTSCSIPACPAAYFDSLIRPWQHSPAIFISGCLVQNWPNYIRITVFHCIAGM